MIRASRELNYGDDWHQALEFVKNDYVDPGKQPELVRSLAEEAIDYVDQARSGDGSAARERRLVGRNALPRSGN